MGLNFLHQPIVNEENSEESRNCNKCGFIGSQKFGLFSISAHSCEKNQFEAKEGGYCTNNCGYFTKSWTNMKNHTRVLICKPNTVKNSSQKSNISILPETLNCDDFIEEMSPPPVPNNSKPYKVIRNNENKITEKLKKWLQEKVILKENI